MTKRFKWRGFSPSQLLVFGFGIMILMGTILLSLPIATKSGLPIRFLDALFTATSAVCVTGLSVFNIGATLSVFGQVTLLVLIQLGGIGFMTMTSMLYMMLGKRFTLRDRLVLQSSMDDPQLQGIVKMVRDILLMTAIIEAGAFLIFTVRFVPMFGVANGLYYSLFQSVSTFCNSGFELFGAGTNLSMFAGDPLVMVTTMCVMVLGGIGFYVILDFYRKAKNKKHHLSLHTKVAVSVSVILTSVGFVLFLLLEYNNPRTLGAENVSAPGKAMLALFQSVSARTAGFAAIPQDGLMPASKIVTAVWMFIGGSPSSMAGGIKTTTIALLFLFIMAIIRGKEDVVVFKRTVRKTIVLRSVVTTALGVVFVCVAIGIVSLIEYDNPITLSDTVYEVVSSFGTVGLTSANTAHFTDASRIVFIILMYGGRVGIFTFTMALAARLERPDARIRYPKDSIMIG